MLINSHFFSWALCVTKEDKSFLWLAVSRQMLCLHLSVVYKKPLWTQSRPKLKGNSLSFFPLDQFTGVKTPYYSRHALYKIKVITVQTLCANYTHRLHEYVNISAYANTQRGIKRTMDAAKRPWYTPNVLLSVSHLIRHLAGNYTAAKRALVHFHSLLFSNRRVASNPPVFLQLWE